MIDKLCKLLNVAEITEDWKGAPSLEIGPWHTADSYEVHVVTNDARQLDWENDVYYYEPSAEDILYRIEELKDNGGTKVYIDNLEDLLPEDEIKSWLEDNYNIDEDEE